MLHYQSQNKQKRYYVTASQPPCICINNTHMYSETCILLQSNWHWFLDSETVLNLMRFTIRFWKRIDKWQSMPALNGSQWYEFMCNSGVSLKRPLVLGCSTLTPLTAHSESLCLLFRSGSHVSTQIKARIRTDGTCPIVPPFWPFSPFFFTCQLLSFFSVCISLCTAVERLNRIG